MKKSDKLRFIKTIDIKNTFLMDTMVLNKSGDKIEQWEVINRFYL